MKINSFTKIGSLSFYRINDVTYSENDRKENMRTHISYLKDVSYQIFSITDYTCLLKPVTQRYDMVKILTSVKG